MAKQKQTQAKNNTLTFYIILAIISFAVYANSLNNEFVFDDESVVLGDPSIMTLKSIPKYFTGEQGFHKVIGRYFRPIVSASYALDYSLWEFKPFGYHLTNVIIHIINVLLLYALLRLMFEKSQSKFKEYGILLGTIIFAVHPIHTEAVAWVSGRTDSLSCTFFFAAFIYYLKFSKNKTARNLVLTLLFYILSLLSKEMAITFPAVIILYDIIVNRMNIWQKEILNEKKIVYSALIIVSVLYFVYRWAVLHQTPQREGYMYFYQKDFMTVVYTMLPTLPLYFRLAVTPYGMLYHYSGYMPYYSSPVEFAVIFSIIFIAVLCFVVYYFYRRIPFIAYSVSFFLITILPVLNIVPTMNFMADRFLYIPSAFLSFLIIAVIYKYYPDKNSNIIIGLSSVLIILYSYMTISRNADWKTNDILFLSAEGKPGTVLFVNLGNIYANKKDYNKAEEYYRKSLDIRSDQVMANNNLGKIFLVKGNFDSAYYYIHKGYLMDTLSPEPMHTMAQLHTRFEKIPEAIYWLEKIQKVTPGYMNSDKTLEQLRAEMQMQQNSKLQNDNLPNDKQMPNINSESMNRIALLEQSSYQNYQSKNYTKAIQELNELIKLNPQRSSGYYNNIGMCYLDQQKYIDAADSFKESIKADKNFSTAYNNLGQCYEKMGDMNMARDNYKKAMETDPANQTAKQNYERIK